MWENAESGVAPCQCFSPGGMRMISPWVTNFSSFSVATIPSPAVTIRICSLSCTRICLVTSGPVKIGLGKGSWDTSCRETIFISSSRERFPHQLHVLDLLELACPSRLENGPHVLLYQQRGQDGGGFDGVDPGAAIRHDQNVPFFLHYVTVYT